MTGNGRLDRAILRPWTFFSIFFKSKVMSTNPRPSKPWRRSLGAAVYLWNPVTVMPNRDWKFREKNTSAPAKPRTHQNTHPDVFFHTYSHMSTLWLNQNFGIFSGKKLFYLKLTFSAHVGTPSIRATLDSTKNIHIRKNDAGLIITRRNWYSFNKTSRKIVYIHKVLCAVN